MNKTKIILSVTGGVAILAVLALGVMAWMSFAERAEAFEGGDSCDGLEPSVSKVVKLMEKKPYPNVENVKRLKENALIVEDWICAVRKEASDGDWRAPECTPAQFKEQLVADVKSLVTPKTVDGVTKDRIVKPDFGFGPFKDYLADKMPSVDQLPRLQRQWYDVVSLVELLEANHVAQVVDFSIVDRAADAAKEAQAAKDKNGKSKKAKKPNNKSKAPVEKKAWTPSVETYRLTFLAKPKSFANVVAALSFQKRFTVIDDFAFVREHDAIDRTLGAGEKKKKEGASAQSGGRRGRRRGASSDETAKKAESAEGEEKRDAVVFDPENDSTFKVDLTVSVYDFRSLEDEGKDEGKGDEK